MTPYHYAIVLRKIDLCSCRKLAKQLEKTAVSLHCVRQKDNCIPTEFTWKTACTDKIDSTQIQYLWEVPGFR